MTRVERFQSVIKPYVPEEKIHVVTLELMCVLLEEIVPIMKEELWSVNERLDQSIGDCRAELDALKGA
jgi:hypothetical protein